MSSFIGGPVVKGMTLRDWFAGQAIGAFVSAHTTPAHMDDPRNARAIAEWAYAVANAMIKANCDLCSDERPGEIYDEDLGAWAVAACGCEP